MIYNFYTIWVQIILLHWEYAETSALVHTITAQTNTKEQHIESSALIIYDYINETPYWYGVLLH